MDGIVLAVFVVLVGLNLPLIAILWVVPYGKIVMAGLGLLSLIVAISLRNTWWKKLGRWGVRL